MSETPGSRFREPEPAARAARRRVRMTIRWKLIVFICVPLVVILGATIAAEYVSLRRLALEKTRHSAVKAADGFAATLDAHFRGVAEISRATAAVLNAAPNLTAEELNELLRDSVARNPFIYGACVAFEPYAFDPGVRLYAPYFFRPRADRVIEHMDVADAYDYTDPRWEWFRVPRETGEPFWTPPFHDEGAGDVVMCTYVTPFFRDGQFRGTSNVDVRLEGLQSAFKPDPDNERAEFSIIGADGTIISDVDPDLIMKETVFTLAAKLNRPRLTEFAHKMIAEKRGVEELTYVENGEAALIAYSPIGSTGWILLAALPTSHALGPVYARLGQRATTALLAVVVVAAIVVVISIVITRPLERLAAAVGELGEGNLAARAIGVRTRDEIGELATAFNGMVVRLRDHIEALKRETSAREAVESELRVAREIQNSLLPRVFPSAAESGGMEVHAVNVPARHVAGDFFDAFPLPGGGTMLVIADVAGKGVPAAMFMAVTRTLLRNFIGDGSHPAEALRRTNAALIANNTGSMFVTLWVGVLHPATGRLVYANAGHPRPLLVRAGEGDPAGAPEFGEVTGPVLGVLEDAAIEEREAVLERGEGLVFYTDGVTEARRPRHEFYGLGRLRTLAQGLAEESPETFCRAVSEAVLDFQSREPVDDITVMVVRRV